jgi:hypothetical protein
MGATFKFWNRLDFIQQLAIGSAFVTGIIVVFTYLLSGGTHYVYVGLVLSTMLALVADRIRQYIFENDLKTQLARVISQVADLHFIGDSNTGIEWIERRCPGAAQVLNTVFLRQGEHLWRLSDESVKVLDLTAGRVLREGGRWHDLFVPSQRNVIEKFYQTLDAKQRDRYRATEISTEFPMTQITVMNFPDHREVLFGFGFVGGRHDDTKVFHSDDANTVSYFDAYFTQLSSKGVMVYPK